MERFSDGNMADVYRVGDTVHKQKGTWWDATRQVLQHLDSVEYLWSPKVISDTSETTELSFIDGETVPADLGGAGNADVLHVIGRRIRELHDALEGFRLAPGTECVPWPVQPPGDNIICHNDLSPWNTVLRDGTFSGFIDWDLVSYGTREWELAWACWRWAPIYPHGKRTRFDASDQIERCRVLLESYGLDAIDLRGFVALIDRRMECALDVVEQLGAQGVPGFDRLLETGMHLSGHDDRAWLAAHRDAFRAGIETL